MKNKFFLKVVSANAYMKDVRLKKQQAIFILDYFVCFFLRSIATSLVGKVDLISVLSYLKMKQKILVLKLHQDMKKHINKQGNKPS